MYELKIEFTITVGKVFIQSSLRSFNNYNKKKMIKSNNNNNNNNMALGYLLNAFMKWNDEQSN